MLGINIGLLNKTLKEIIVSDNESENDQIIKVRKKNETMVLLYQSKKVLYQSIVNPLILNTK